MYVNNYKGDKEFIGATFLLLDVTIGECDVMTSIGSVEFKDLEGQDKHKLHPLRELPKIIDTKKTSINN